MIDLRQVMAAFLTFSMFVMLGNMIKRDHIDPLLGPLQVTKDGKNFDDFKIRTTRMMSDSENGPWKLKTKPMKPCWKMPLSKGKEKQDNGYIFFSLTRGPEFHAAQVANAVIIARKLGATLAVPDIIGTRVGDKRQFGEVYDLNNFITSLKGVVKVEKNPPFEISKGKLQILRVPNGVSDEYITSRISPIFRTKKNLKIVTSFDSSTMTEAKEQERSSNPYQCLSMFKSLKLQPDLQEVVDSMLSTLRSLSPKSNGRFVAVDLKVDMLEKKSCQKNDANKQLCFNAQEIGNFLEKIGFNTNTTIYLSEKGWNRNLNPLRDIFPNTFTKDAIIPADEKARFMDSESGEYEKLIDYYVCEKGDVFVPAYGSKFYDSVVGRRIASDNTQIFVPSKNSLKNATDYISPYVAKKSHSAYSCFC